MTAKNLCHRKGFETLIEFLLGKSEISLSFNEMEYNNGRLKKYVRQKEICRENVYTKMKRLGTRADEMSIPA